MTVLELSVTVTSVREVVSPRGTVRMIHFTGSCAGPYFQGEIEPGGVDTQLPDASGRVTLSARYMLSGTDRDGNPARIFIENNALAGEETHPLIRTDSPCLAFLETAPLTGQIRSEGGCLRITIQTP